MMASALWHGFADMGAVEKNGAFVVSRGEGAYIWDREGTRYLDATAGLWFTNVGHGRTEIADAVAAQKMLERPHHPLSRQSNLPRWYNTPPTAYR